MIIIIPLGTGNIKDNMKIQLISFFITMLIFIEWIISSLIHGLDTTSINTFGQTSSSYTGLPIILMNFAFVITVPSWINIKKNDVNIQRTVWIASTLSVICYVLVGIFRKLSRYLLIVFSLSFIGNSCFIV